MLPTRFEPGSRTPGKRRSERRSDPERLPPFKSGRRHPNFTRTRFDGRERRMAIPPRIAGLTLIVVQLAPQRLRALQPTFETGRSDRSVDESCYRPNWTSRISSRPSTSATFPVTFAGRGITISVWASRFTTRPVSISGPNTMSKGFSPKVFPIRSVVIFSFNLQNGNRVLSVILDEYTTARYSIASSPYAVDLTTVTFSSD